MRLCRAVDVSRPRPPICRLRVESAETRFSTATKLCLNLNRAVDVIGRNRDGGGNGSANWSSSNSSNIEMSKKSLKRWRRWCVECVLDEDADEHSIKSSSNNNQSKRKKNRMKRRYKTLLLDL